MTGHPSIISLLDAATRDYHGLMEGICITIAAALVFKFIGLFSGGRGEAGGR